MHPLKTLAIKQARNLLSKHPPDAYHTVRHHQETYKNVLDIIDNENLNLDTSLLEIAAWWHDVFKNNPKEKELMSNELAKLTFKKEEIERIIDVIKHHSFGEKQQNIEAKLLYDADKIELVSVDRWKAAFKQFDMGQISEKERDKYIPEWNRRMPLLMDNLNFAYSNRLFKRKYQECIRWAKSIGRYQNNLFI